MTQRLFVMALVTAVVSFTDIRAGQRPAEPARGAAAVPVVIRADHHDRSPQLRDVPPGRPPLGEAVGEREPKWRRVSRHPSGLLPDSMVQTTPAAAVMPA